MRILRPCRRQVINNLPFHPFAQVIDIWRLTLTHSLHDITRHPVSTPLIINLPACPVQDIADVDSYLPRFLRRYPSATIHYRWPGAHDLLKATSPTPLPSTSPSPSPSPHEDEYQQHHHQRPFRWPTPIHDTLAGYDHLQRTLGAPPPPPAPPTTPATIATIATSGADGLPPPPPPPREVYVYGSYLGANLAAALALTEAYAHNPALDHHRRHRQQHRHEEAQAAHQAMTVRGLLALNGLYNWTTLLPDHPIHRRRAALAAAGLRLTEEEGAGGGAGGDLGVLRRQVARLFARPGDLFDPFASPVLFFHTAGIMVPPAFGERWRPDYPPRSPPAPPAASSSARSTVLSSPADDVYVYSDPEDLPPPSPYPDEEGEHAETNTDADADFAPPDPLAPPPRRGYLAFPPRASGLCIPETLLLHSTPPPQSTRRPRERGGGGGGAGGTGVGAGSSAALWRKLRNAENSFGSQAAGLAGLMRRSVDSLELRGSGKRWDGGDGEEEAIRRVKTEDVGRVDGRDGLGMGERAEEVAGLWLEERLG